MGVMVLSLAGGALFFSGLVVLAMGRLIMGKNMEREAVLERNGIIGEEFMVVDIGGYMEGLMDMEAIIRHKARVGGFSDEVKPTLVKGYLKGGKVEDMFDVVERSKFMVRGIVFRDMVAKEEYELRSETGCHARNNEWWWKKGQDYLNNIRDGLS
jgi:hypothetical protein